MTVVKQIISSLLCLSGSVTVEMKLWGGSSSLTNVNQSVLCWLSKQFFTERLHKEEGTEIISQLFELV